MSFCGRVPVVLCLAALVSAFLCREVAGAGSSQPMGTSEASFVKSVVLGPLRSDFDGWVGMWFTVGSTPLRVTALGRTRVAGNSEAHVVKLVRASGEADVDHGRVVVEMSEGVEGGFVYGAITNDVILEPFADYYLVTEERHGGDLWHDLYSSATTTEVAAENGGVYAYPPGDGYTTAGYPGQVYGAVDFKYAIGGGLFPPAVTLLGVVDGASYLAGGVIELRAFAAAEDGGIDRVEFYRGATLLGEDLTAPFSLVWTEPLVGTHELWAVATDSYGAVATSAVVNIAIVVPAVLIETNSSWWYWDEGSEPETNWTVEPLSPSWQTGGALLGYGTGNEVTMVGYGPDPGERHITTYFKRLFVLEELPDFTRLIYEMLRDDGVVVYLNGVEVYRDNLPPGELTGETLALADVDLEAGEGWVRGELPADLLVGGVNVIAVEVHQSAADSPDLAFALGMTAACPEAVLLRGPYLQQGTTGSVIVKWRTDVAGASRVEFGTEFNLLDRVAEDRSLTTEHEVLVTGLQPDTRYYYSIGSLTARLASGPEYFLVTAPEGAKPTRVWVLGDSGTANDSARMVRDAYYQFTGSRHTDLWLMLGDNAYNQGRDYEYQAAVFDMYPGMLGKSVLWPAIGNHDTGFLSNPPPDLPYFQIFSLPRFGEAGGMPSGTEKYYSFDYGNIHFVCLDSMSSDRRQGGVMASWLETDLAANTNDWLIAFWHHPPYTKGSHNSDLEPELIEMREQILPILESYGVDLVLAGHSHCYERSKLLHGHYGLSSSLTPAMVLNSGSGGWIAQGGYHKTEQGSSAGAGTVYVVAGSSGSARGGGSLDHPAMYLSLLEAGSVVLDIDGKVLHATFLRETGEVRDQFTILKGDPGNLPFRITSHHLESGMLTLTWNSFVGESYSVQCSTNVMGSDWIFVTGVAPATGAVASATIELPGGARNAIYRVVHGGED